MNSFLSIKNFFKLGLFILFFNIPLSMTTWASDSTDVAPPAVTSAATYLLTKGVLVSVYVNSSGGGQPVSWAVSTKPCPTGLTPTYNVAVNQGFISSSGSSEDKGIRGIHLKVSNISTTPPNNNIFLTFSDAYVDTIGEADKPIDVAYWIYCGPGT